MTGSAQSDPASLASQRGLRPSYDELCENTRLLTTLRWVAGCSILLVTATAEFVLGVQLETAPLLLIGVIVLGYNAVLYSICRSDRKTLTRARHVAWIQIVLDWIAMVLLVHYTGGITSPALIYFVIHAALAGTILLPREARAVATVAILCVCGIAVLERSAMIPHVTIPELGLDRNLYRNNTYTAAVLFFFGTTIATLSELVTHKAQQSRQREEYIRQLYEARSTFVRITTHELRSPLAAGLSLVRNIEAGYAGELNPTQHDMIHRITVRLEGLSTLVDELLTLASSREASLAQAPLEPIEARAVLENVIERELPNAEKKHIHLETQLDAPSATVMSGDPGLSIVFGNLLNNAIKYTPENGQVTVRYHVDSETNEVQVSVQDTGIGIPQEDQPHIFQEFHRARNARALTVQGTGIGLTAVQTLVTRYHGQIGFESVEGRRHDVQRDTPDRRHHARAQPGEVNLPRRCKPTPFK